MDASRKERLFEAKSELKNSLSGIEQETLRITKQGLLSKTDHPHVFGAPLTHKHLKTDFGEQQPELVTFPSKDKKHIFAELSELKRFMYEMSSKELLWPLSMPCELPKKIPVAKYGSTFEAEMKTLYRMGLSHRYGQNMQMISGIHFNHSFSQKFWELFGENISDNYLHICRNFLRYGWLVTYLYGASPACDRSFGIKGLKQLDKTTFYHPYATSLRMSPYGYYSRIQQQLAISYNSVPEYIAGIRQGIHTHNPSYAHIKEQINSNILQYQNEHYARIRPKPSIEEIEKEGIHYVEVRSIDLDPFEPLGIGACQYSFLELFILYCLVKESPPLTKKEQQVLCHNQCEVSLHGRAPHLMLKKGGRSVLLKTWAHSILDEIEQLTPLLPSCSTERHRSAVNDPDKTLSGKVLSHMKEHSLTHSAFGLERAKIHKKELIQKPLPQKALKKWQKEAEISLQMLREKESLHKVLLFGYEDMELSTQFLLRECLKQGITFEIIDRSANIVLLKQGKKEAYVRQATKTALDTYIAAELMGNKEATKVVLRKHGIRVPSGGQAHTFKEAQELFAHIHSRKVVVKPNTTNFGKGVHIFPRKDEAMLLSSCKVAFSLDTSVLVEEFVEGTEYRLLVIGKECVGVIEREPAHIYGDGKSSIKKCIEQKNLDINRYRPPSERIYLGAHEKMFLSIQKLTPNSIPKKGQKIYLRENSNVSTGGDAIDRTDEMHSSYKRLAVECAQAMGATFCGVDMVIPNMKKAGEYAIIELNYNPMIATHEMPHRGKARPISKHILKVLGFKVR